MFDWDDANRKHVAEHGVEPVEAEEVVANKPIDLELQYRDGKERVLQIGETNALRILVVVTTWRGSKIRVVTAFPATPQLRRFYAAHKGTGNEGKEDAGSRFRERSAGG